MKLLVIIVTLIISWTTIAQEKIDKSTLPKNAINFNVLGDISIISASYERAIWFDSFIFFTAKMGIGYNDNKRFSIDLNLYGAGPSTFILERYLTSPYHITACYGDGRHFFEVGVGGTYLKGNSFEHNLFYPIFGYRLMGHKTSNGSFRIYLNIPLTESMWDVKFRVYPFGLNMGIIF